MVNHDLGPGPRMPEKKRQTAYELSKCMTCGVCLEVCPNVTEIINSLVHKQSRKFVCLICTQQDL